ncbi:MAG: MarR family transcriptional regulator [Rhodocyclaceae bacterium]
MHYVRMGLIRHLERDLGATGCELNFSQFRVLKTLARDESLTASELARRVEHDAGALTRMLDRLQDKGYVIR